MLFALGKLEGAAHASILLEAFILVVSNLMILLTPLKYLTVGIIGWDYKWKRVWLMGIFIGWNDWSVPVLVLCSMHVAGKDTRTIHGWFVPTSYLSRYMPRDATLTWLGSNWATMVCS